MHLTQNQFQLLVPSDISDDGTPRWPAMVATGVDTLCGYLPFTMQPLIRSQDFTGKPELEAYYMTYLRPWLAWLIQQDLLLYANNTSLEGSSYPMQPFTQNAQQSSKTLAANGAQIKVDLYKNNALKYWQQVNYVFDNVAYPPTPNQTGFWQDVWHGSIYGFRNGLWGWQSPRIGTDSTWTII